MPNVPSACRVSVLWADATIRRDQPTQTETVLSYAEIIQSTEDVVLVRDSIRRDQSTQTNANKICKRPSFWKRIKSVPSSACSLANFNFG